MSSLLKLKQNDYDRYISSIFIEKDKFDDVMKILNFNIEIAQIKNKINEPTLGFIRLKWWYDELEKVLSNNSMSNNQILADIKNVILKHKLDKSDFLEILIAREKDFVEYPFKTIDEVESYLVSTNFVVNKLITEILVKNPSKEILDKIENCSKLWALSAILFSANKNFARGRNIFPENLCKKYNLKTQDYGSQNFLASAEKITEELIYYFQNDIESSNFNIDKNIKIQLKPILLYEIIASYRLNQIKQNNYDIFTKNYNPYLSLASLFKIYFH